MKMITVYDYNDDSNENTDCNNNNISTTNENGKDVENDIDFIHEKRS